MQLFPPTGLAENIVLELRRGPVAIPALLSALEKHGKRVTKQGAYKALRILREQEIVFLHRSEVTLNVRWLQTLDHFVSLTQHAYIDSQNNTGNFLNLQDGERITFSFNHPALVDAYWNHILYILFEAFPSLDKWFAYSPHHWFLLARRREELALMKFMASRHIRILFTIGSKTPLDRAVKKEFDGEAAQCHILDAPLFAHRQNHLGTVLNVIGDYVIEARYHPQTVTRIEEFYRTHARVSEEGIKELETIVTAPAKTKLTISKDKSRAKKLSRMFEKHFYFPAKKEAS